MSDYDGIVIGAGCGGLTAGSLLAKEGRSILVLEQSERIGGCCSTFVQDGYSFDLGASIVEDTEVIDWAFQQLGTSLAEAIELIPCDPIYSVIMQDGTKVQIPLSLEKTSELLTRFSESNKSAWKSYSETMEGFLKAALPGFFPEPARNVSDLVRMFSRTPALLKYGSLFISSYRDIMRKYFKDEKFLETVSFHPFYTGLPPELSPGYFAMIPYSEHKGIFYPKGGMIQIPNAFSRIGKSFGMKIETGKRVDSLLIEGKRVLGVKLADGTEIRSKFVVSNINAKTLYLKLIGEDKLPWMTKVGVKSYEYSMATPMIYLGLKEKPDLDAHHTLATLPMDQMDSYWNQEYLKGRYPKEQFGIISWTTKTDPNLAPKGKHVVILTLAPGPYKLEEGNWDTRKEKLMSDILETFESKYIPGLKSKIEFAAFATPFDFERNLLSPEGAIYALRQDLANATVFRPSAKSKSFKGLYLVGASTHPGGGVPTVIASGMIAHKLINKYERD